MHTRLGRNLATFPANMDIPRALDHYRAAGAILTRGPARSALGYVVFGLAATALWAMRTEEGLAQVEQALEIADRRGNDSLARNAIALRGHHVLCSGHLADGFRGLERAWEAADRAEHLMPAFSASWIAAGLSLHLRDPRTAMTWCRRELGTPGSPRPEIHSGPSRVNWPGPTPSSAIWARPGGWRRRRAW